MVSGLAVMVVLLCLTTVFKNMSNNAQVPFCSSTPIVPTHLAWPACCAYVIMSAEVYAVPCSSPRNPAQCRVLASIVRQGVQ